MFIITARVACLCHGVTVAGGCISGGCSFLGNRFFFLEGGGPSKLSPLSAILLNNILKSKFWLDNIVPTIYVQETFDPFYVIYVQEVVTHFI